MFILKFYILLKQNQNIYLGMVHKTVGIMFYFIKAESLQEAAVEI